MPLLAGSVIDQARDRHAAFDRQHHPAKGALRFLSSYVKQLHGKVTRLDSSIITLSLDTALPLAVHEDGITLPAGTRLVQEAVANPATTAFVEPVPVAVLDFAQRFAPNAPRLAGWQQAGVFYLRSPNTLWSRCSSVTLTLSVLPLDLSTLEDTLAIPDAAELACVEAVASFFADRESQERETRISPDRFVAKAADAEAQFLNDVVTNLSGRVFFTQDTYQP